MAAYQSDSVLSSGDASHSCGADQDIGTDGTVARADAQVRFARYVQERTGSMTEAARVFGIDVVTAMAWAAKAGVSSRRRPKFLKPMVRMRLVRALAGGMDKKVAAARFSISASTVDRVLMTEPGLSDRWRTARRLRKQARARGEWLRSAKENLQTGVKAARFAAPRAFAWLYRHDRAWLVAHSKAFMLQPMNHTSTVDWDRRDVEFSQSVRRVRLALEEASPGRVVTLLELYARIPELQAKLGQLHRLPLTRRALEQATGRPRRRMNRRMLE